MNSGTLTANEFSGSDITSGFRGWVIAAGIMSLALGTAAIIYDNTATTISVLVFGWLLIVAGATQIVNAIQFRAWNGFFLYLLDGIVRATVGTLLILYPQAGAQSLTLVLSVYFIVGGTFKAIGSTVLRFPSWGWSVASGLVSVGLGTMLALQWPTSATWFIGFAVGFDLIVYGWALLMFAAAVKQIANAFK
jgi:uncharacterized membrane protein HdeD (DUF308 family)